MKQFIIITVLLSTILLPIVFLMRELSIQDKYFEQHAITIKGEVFDVKYAIGGINIQKAIWHVRWENGNVTTESCTSCMDSEIPYEGQGVIKRVLPPTKP